MFGLLDWIKLGVGAVAGAALGYLAGYSGGALDGRAAVRAEIAAAAAQQERERVTDDATLRDLPDDVLCARGLAARGLPVDACAELRGLAGQ